MQPSTPIRYGSIEAGQRMVAAAIAAGARVYRHLPLAASALLCGIVVLQLAAIGRALSAPSAAIALPPGGGAASSIRLSGAPDARGIAAAHLFGVQAQAATAVEPALAPAPDTTLSLQMSGILFSEIAAASRIIVADGEREHSYATGDRIDGFAVTVRAIHADRAIIEHDGRLETLRLPRDFGGGASPMPMPALQAATESAPLPESPALSYAAAAGPPLKDIIGVAPRRDPDGRGASFTLNPGRHWKAAIAAGLKAGALVVDVNGIALGDDPESGIQRFREALGSATLANITVRNSDATLETITLDSSKLLR